MPKNKELKQEKIVNYFLNLLSNKILEARIVGVLDNNTYCLEVNNNVTLDSNNNNSQTKVSKVNLNEKVIKDGFGEYYEDKKQSGVS